MELSSAFIKLKGFLNKYKYAVIVLLIGCILLALPSFNSKEIEKASDNVTQEVTYESLSDKLEKILMRIDGAGDVCVMLSTAESEKTLYQTDSRITDSDTNNATDISTIIITDEERTETGLVQQVISPKYQGAIIVCEGAENPTVRLSIIDAVSKITGLKTDKISVLKMK